MAEKFNKNEILEAIGSLDEATECQVKLTGPQLATHQLYEAITKNDIDAARNAIENGAWVNAQCPPCATNGGTPLDCAMFWVNVYENSPDMIEFLKESGATDYNLDRAEFVAEAKRCPTLVHIIMKRKFK